MAARLRNTVSCGSVKTSAVSSSLFKRVSLCLTCRTVNCFYTTNSSTMQCVGVGFPGFKTRNISRFLPRIRLLCPSTNQIRVISSSGQVFNLLDRERTASTLKTQAQHSTARDTQPSNLWMRLKDSSQKAQDSEEQQDKIERKAKLEIKSSDTIQSWLDSRKDNSPIWAKYRRNHKGQLAPEKTRKKCIRGKAVCGNPCPICQLKVQLGYSLSHMDVTLLEHFVCPHTGLILQPSKTGVCREQQRKLEDAIEKARDHGLMAFTVPGPRDPPKPFTRAGIPVKIKNKM